MGKLAERQGRKPKGSTVYGNAMIAWLQKLLYAKNLPIFAAGH
jgi:hypothetical protein